MRTPDVVPLAVKITSWLKSTAARSGSLPKLASMTRASLSLSSLTTSTTQTLPKLSQASTSTPRAPSSDHNAISNAPVSEPGTMATWKSFGRPRSDLVRSMRELEKRLSLFRPVRAAEERRRRATARTSRGAWHTDPTKSAGWPDAWPASSGAVICLPFQIGAPSRCAERVAHWGSRRRTAASQPRPTVEAERHAPLKAKSVADPFRSATPAMSSANRDYLIAAG